MCVLHATDGQHSGVFRLKSPSNSAPLPPRVRPHDPLCSAPLLLVGCLPACLDGTGVRSAPPAVAGARARLPPSGRGASRGPASPSRLLCSHGLTRPPLSTVGAGAGHPGGPSQGEGVGAQGPLTRQAFCNI